MPTGASVTKDAEGCVSDGIAGVAAVVETVTLVVLAGVTDGEICCGHH